MASARSAADRVVVVVVIKALSSFSPMWDMRFTD
jgi:hypothetical protein